MFHISYPHIKKYVLYLVNILYFNIQTKIILSINFYLFNFLGKIHIQPRQKLPYILVNLI